MNQGHGFGKVILFGEHFVVHGLPAIVSAINHTIIVSVEPSKDYEFIDKTIKFPGVPDLTWDLCQKPMLTICHHLGITTPLKIIHGGKLPIPHSGIGSSAAACVALARALNNQFNLNLTDHEINAAAFEGEKEIHGNPSGIDNTAATFGGMFWFEKGKPIEPIFLKNKVEIVLTDSGKETKTKEVIEAVKTFSKTNPKKFLRILEAYKVLVTEAKRALEENDFLTVGLLMSENQKLLNSLTVSCEEIDTLVDVARATGALGAKLTGTGRGGLVFALTPGKDLQYHVARAWEKLGCKALKTEIP